MNLWKSANNTWQLWLSRSEAPPNGKMVSLKKIAGHSVYDEDEAKEYLKELRENWHKRKIIELRNGPSHSLSKFKKKYFQNRSHLSESTVRMDEMALKFFLEIVGDKISVEIIRKKHIDLFIEILKAREVTPTSINSYLRHFRAAYNSACELYDIKPIKVKLLRTVKSPLAILTRAEIDKILEYAKKNDFEMYRIIHFAIWTGCRRSEILGLNYADIKNGNICIKGKGGKVRYIPQRDLINQNGVGKIFKQFHKDTVSKRFAAICKKLKIKAHFHSLRHSAATYMIQSGINPKAVQAILGHADFRTTEIYINVCNEWIQGEIEKYRI